MLLCASLRLPIYALPMFELMPAYHVYSATMLSLHVYVLFYARLIHISVPPPA